MEPWLLALVPARGGSKGLPRKNARRLCDHPLLAWTADAFRCADIQGSRLVLSTDDPEIASIGAQVGMETPFVRPASISGDEASAEAVALHALDWFEREQGVHFRAVLWLQPTSPFRDPMAIRQAVTLLTTHAGECVLGVKPIYRTAATLFRLGDEGRLTPLGEREELKTRRQDVAPLYTPNGALYLVPTDVLRRERSFFPAATRALVMDDIASLDIDTPTDWAIAEAIAASGRTWRSSSAASRAS